MPDNPVFLGIQKASPMPPDTPMHPTEDFLRDLQRRISDLSVMIANLEEEMDKRRQALTDLTTQREALQAAQSAAESVHFPQTVVSSR